VALVVLVTVIHFATRRRLERRDQSAGK